MCLTSNQIIASSSLIVVVLLNIYWGLDKKYYEYHLFSILDTLHSLNTMIYSVQEAVMYG